jgi:hypothetical protein
VAARLAPFTPQQIDAMMVNTQGTPMVVSVTPAAGSLVIVVQNKHASAEALNGTLVISFFAVKG